MKAYIPFTEARRERLFVTILRKWVGDKDGLANVEWPDGTKSLEPVEVDTDNSALVDENDNRWFFRGLGGESCNWNGVPVWDVYAGNAGVISTEATLIADAEEYGDRVVDVGAGEELPDDLVVEGLVDPNGQQGPGDAWQTDPVDREVVEVARSIEAGDLEAVRPDDLRQLAKAVEEGPNGSLSERVAGLFGRESWDMVLDDITVDSSELSADDADGNGHARADGGVTQASGARQQAPGARQPGPKGDHDIPEPSELPDDTAVYVLRPPDGYDGVAISVRSPDYYDPFPVTRGDAKDAAEWAQRAGEQGKDKWMAGFIVGLLVFGALWLLMTVVPWLLGEIGGSGGGGGETLPGLLFLATPAVDGLRERLSAVAERLASWGD